MILVAVSSHRAVLNSAMVDHTSLNCNFRQLVVDEFLSGRTSATHLIGLFLDFEDLENATHTDANNTQYQMKHSIC